jgi:hypothetical protein
MFTSNLNPCMYPSKTRAQSQHLPRKARERTQNQKVASNGGVRHGQHSWWEFEIHRRCGQSDPYMWSPNGGNAAVSSPGGGAPSFLPHPQLRPSSSGVGRRLFTRGGSGRVECGGGGPNGEMAATLHSPERQRRHAAPAGRRRRSPDHASGVEDRVQRRAAAWGGGGGEGRPIWIWSTEWEMGIIELGPGPGFAGQTLTDPACLTTTRPGPYYSVRVGRVCHSLGPTAPRTASQTTRGPPLKIFASGPTRATRRQRSTDVSATSKQLRQLGDGQATSFFYYFLVIITIK